MKVQGEEAKGKIQLLWDSLTRSSEEESYDADLTWQQYVPFQSQISQATVRSKPYQSKNLNDPTHMGSGISKIQFFTHP